MGNGKSFSFIHSIEGEKEDSSESSLPFRLNIRENESRNGLWNFHIFNLHDFLSVSNMFDGCLSLSVKVRTFKLFSVI